MVQSRLAVEGVEGYWWVVAEKEVDWVQKGYLSKRGQ